MSFKLAIKPFGKLLFVRYRCLRGSRDLWLKPNHNQNFHLYMGLKPI